MRVRILGPLLLLAPACALALGPYTARPVSLRQDGAATADAFSEIGSMADDGTITFSSTAGNLVGTPGNGQAQLYVEGPAGKVRVSRSPTDVPGNNTSLFGEISRDARYVAFFSLASNLVAGFVNGGSIANVYRADLATGTIELTSHVPASATTAGNGSAFGPVITVDGRCVAFSSDSTNLTPDPAVATSSAYLWNQGTVSLVSFNAAGTATANGASSPIAISTDCRYVLFRSSGSDLIVGSASGLQLYLRDTVARTTVLVSHAASSASTATNGRSDGLAMTPDGRYVAFYSYGTDLVAGQADAAQTDDVFRWERGTGAVRLVSHAVGAPAQTGNGVGAGIGAHAISDDGQRVVYYADSSDLASTPDTNSKFDVFLWNAGADTSSLLSTNAAGTASANGDSLAAVINAVGTIVAFETAATNLAAGISDSNNAKDVYRYEIASGAKQLISSNSGSAQTGNGESTRPALSSNGELVGFMSLASSLAPVGDTNNGTDVFRASDALFANGFE